MASAQRVAIQALLERSGREFVPIRRSLLQTRNERKTGGPTSRLGKREAALDLYLLLHALASRDPWDVALSARVWARLVGAGENASGTTLVSRQWSWLEEQRLVRTSRAGRTRRIFLLHEDGSGRPYTHPGAASADGPAEGDYFQLPYAYWRGGWDARLSLAGKLVLLIACSLRDPFILPLEHAAKWYGLSANRLHRGLSELRAVGLLDMKVTSRPAPLTDRGLTFERHYTLRALRTADPGDLPPPTVSERKILIELCRAQFKSPGKPVAPPDNDEIAALLDPPSGPGRVGDAIGHLYLKYGLDGPAEKRRSSLVELAMNHGLVSASDYT